ncbi:MAG: C39 family peptidase [Elusimicrobiaceae bacterium]|nr:C39 family peptidase [Elusimicrobiaceae bacterium]
MHTHSRACVFNQFHSPKDAAQETFSGDIKIVTSGVFRTPFLFDRLVLSANFRTATDGCLLLEVQVCVNQTWSEFYKLGLLSGKFKTSFPSQQDNFGRVETDQLVLFSPAQAYRYRLRFYGDSELLLLAVSGVRAPFVYDEKTAVHLPCQANLIQVPPLSQLEQDTPHKRRICSPTSLYMALNALGYVVPLQQILPRVFDQIADVYGNWLFNISAAAEFGAEAFFRRFASLAELEEFVTPDSLVIASIAFKKDELTGAPLEKTPGHLVLIRGYEPNRVLVADPAAPTQRTVLRAYDAQQFARAWLCNKQGAAYVVRRK